MSEKENKVIGWMKKHRQYIVLALCILTISGTYMLLSRTPTQAPQYDETDTQNSADETNTPLPDLADYFPPELEPDAIEQKRQSAETRNARPVETDEDARSASADAPAVEKKSLVYVRPLEGEIQKPFSGTTLVYSATMADWRVHSGADIAAEAGTNVGACAEGVISKIYTDARMGITIVIDHQNGIQSVYANLSNGNLVREGQRVSAGETISTVGTTAAFEAADESHLHFELLQNGELIDPATILP